MEPTRRHRHRSSSP